MGVCLSRIKKVDTDLTYSTEYKRMSDAIAELSETSGKPPILLSLCEWGLVCLGWFSQNPIS